MNRVDDLSSQAIHKDKFQLEMVEATNQEMVEPKVEDENKNTLAYRFKQQLINAWRPVPSLSSSITLYLVLSTRLVTQLPFSPRSVWLCSFLLSSNTSLRRDTTMTAPSTTLPALLP